MGLRPVFGSWLHRFRSFETLKSFMGPYDQPPTWGASLYLFSGTSLRTCPAFPAAAPPTCVSCWLLHPTSLCHIIMPSSSRLKLYDLCRFRYVDQEIKKDLIHSIGYDAAGRGWWWDWTDNIVCKEEGVAYNKCILLSVSKRRVKGKLEIQPLDRHRTGVSKKKSKSINHANGYVKSECFMTISAVHFS